MLSTILRPFSYLFIKHPSKYVIDWAVPLLASLLLTCFSWIASSYSERDLAWIFIHEDISSLVGILPGFYIAALSAIVVFNRNDIDRHMPKPTPVLKGRTGEMVSLTRRRFLAITFSFLTAESILLLMVIGLKPMAAIILLNLASKDLLNVYNTAYYFIVYLIFAQLIAVTFLCLYYLGERLHQPDP